MSVEQTWNKWQTVQALLANKFRLLENLQTKTPKNSVNIFACQLKFGLQNSPFLNVKVVISSGSLLGQLWETPAQFLAN